MDWFEHLTGFAEQRYSSTQARFEVKGDRLISLVNGKSYRIGQLELASLRELRGRAEAAASRPGRLKLAIVRGDVRQLHRLPEYAGALFQVASQFNLLEMVSPNVSPEAGVTRYQHDHTQGPACALAAGAATIYRNYFVPVAGQIGQSEEHQLDGLSDLGNALGKAVDAPVDSFWNMRNGYALCSKAGLEKISFYLDGAAAEQVDALRSLLRIGLHHDVEVTDGDAPIRPLVTQAFCSALPVAYSDVPSRYWERFARLVLEAAYEATLWAGVDNACRGNSNIVMLTRLGGGAFGNADTWIDAAMYRALEQVSQYDLDVRIVSYSAPSGALVDMVERFKSNS